MPLRLSHRPDFPWNSLPQACVVFAVCLFSRLITTIHHIEDADSLRFALAMIDFDVTRLQPQFPGYPVFCFFSKGLYALTGSYSLAFSALGGIGLFVLLHYSLALLDWRFSEARGKLVAVLFIFNPMLWVLGNRFMSDLSGAACVLAAFYHLSRAADSRRHALTGFFLAGILAGWRLSYLPFLTVALLLAFLRGRERFQKVVAGITGVLVWFVPFLLVTGWTAMLAAARGQTHGHFSATGGTYRTEPDWGLRAARMFQDAWVDGLGAWWPGRHPVTLLVSLGAAFFLLRALILLRRGGLNSRLQMLVVSCLTYGAWIYFFQNVIHQTRHVLPLIPPVLMALAIGLPSNWRGWNLRTTLLRTAAGFFLAAYVTVGLVLAVQHMRPSAIAQAKHHLETHPQPDAILVAAPWVEKSFSAQGIRMEFHSVDSPAELASLRELDPTRRIVTVGDYSDYMDRPVVWRKTFYHNPYVNRLGSRIEMAEYGPKR